MTIIEVLCEFYHLKEQEDQNKTNRDFKHSYENLDESNRFSYVLEREVVYGKERISSTKIDEFAKKFVQFSTFEIESITQNIIRVLESITGERYINYLTPFMIQSVHGPNIRYEKEQKIGMVIFPEINQKRPQPLNWFEKNTSKYYTDIGMAGVSGIEYSSPTVPSIFTYNNIMFLCSTEELYIPSKINIYAYTGYTLREYYLNSINSQIRAYIESLILYRMENNLTEISKDEIDEFTSHYIKSISIGDKGEKLHIINWYNMFI